MKLAKQAPKPCIAYEPALFFHSSKLRYFCISELVIILNLTLVLVKKKITLPLSSIIVSPV